MSIAIAFDRVSRKFTLNEQRPQSFQELMMSLFRRKEKQPLKEFWALRDVTFQLKHGETLGLLGANGAGKSTLLKLIACTIPPTTGRLQINGRVSALLELGAGFHDDLSGRENIQLNGAILGLSRAEIDRKLDAIIDFAELERFIDMPVKHYSSGMYLRLGFSVAVHTDPEILVVDEALAVGDRSFQLKCLRRINALKDQGLTIVFVSHSLDLIRSICTSAIWMHHGEIQARGSIEQVSAAYLEYVAQSKDQSQLAQQQQAQNRWGSGEAKVTQLDFLNEQREPAHLFDNGGCMIVRIHYQADERIEAPRFGLAFYHAESGTHLSGPNNILGHYDISYIEGRGYVDFKITALPFLSGDFLVSAAIYDYAGEHAYDHRHQMGFFTIAPKLTTLASGKAEGDYGLMSLPAIWSTSTHY